MYVLFLIVEMRERGICRYWWPLKSSWLRGAHHTQVKNLRTIYSRPSVFPPYHLTFCILGFKQPRILQYQCISISKSRGTRGPTQFEPTLLKGPLYFSANNILSMNSIYSHWMKRKIGIYPPLYFLCIFFFHLLLLLLLLLFIIHLFLLSGD